MAFMPAELDDDYDGYEDGFTGDEEFLQSYHMSNPATVGKSKPPVLKSHHNSNNNHRIAFPDQKSSLSSHKPSNSNWSDLRYESTRNGRKNNAHNQMQPSVQWKPSLSTSSSSASYFDSSAPHILTEEDLKIAAVKGNVESVKKCIQQGLNINASLQSGWTPMMYACNHGKWRVVEALLKEGADPSCHVDLFTPLMSACSSSAPVSESLKCVTLLVEAGADVNSKDRYHSTGLILAARLGHLDLVQYLIDLGATVNDQDSRGWTALSWSVQRGQKEVVVALLESGADCNIAHTDRLTVKDVAAHLPTDEMLALLERRPARSSGDGDDVTGRGVASARDAWLFSNPSILQEGEENIKSTDLRFGELEIFLLGLDLAHLLPLFRKHLIDLFLLLELTEQDLLSFGVEQLGARKKILDATRAVHNKNWETSSLVSAHFNKRISCGDSVAMIANISKHLRYIKSTVVYVRKQLQHHPQSVLLATDSASPIQLFRHVVDTRKHTEMLEDDLLILHKDLSKAMQNENLDPPDLIPPRKRPTKQMMIVLPGPVQRCVDVCAGAVIVAGLALCWQNRGDLNHWVIKSCFK